MLGAGDQFFLVVITWNHVGWLTNFVAQFTVSVCPAGPFFEPDPPERQYLAGRSSGLYVQLSQTTADELPRTQWATSDPAAINRVVAALQSTVNRSSWVSAVVLVCSLIRLTYLNEYTYVSVLSFNKLGP